MGLFNNKDDVKGNKRGKAAKPGGAAKASAEKSSGAGRGRKSEFVGKRIYITAKENPYRKDSNRFKNFEAIKEGMSFEQYKEAGLDTLLLKYGVNDGHLSAR